MPIQLAHRTTLIKPSATLAVSTKANELKAQGKNIINLSVGEPDFDTPEFIKEAGIKAIQSGFTKYTPVPGTPGLKNAIVAKFKRENDLNYTSKQILVSCGAKQSFYNLVQAVINPGDEVIIPAPYWVSYPEMVLIAEGMPVFVSASMQQNFKITPQQLQQAITPKTRMVIINSPSNPSGMMYTKQELAALGEVLRKYPQIVVASDDIYEHNIWEKNSFVNILQACPELYDQTVVINGASKAYAMTGWRIGYAAGPVAVIDAMMTIQSQSTSGANSIAQVAAQAALEGDQTCIDIMVASFKKRHDLAREILNAIPGINCLATDGTFYLFPDMRGVIERLPGVQDDIELCSYLLDQADAALVPGTPFGAPGHVRLSIAVAQGQLEQALLAVKKVLEK